MNFITYFIGGKKVSEKYIYRGEGNLHLALELINSKKIMLIRKAPFSKSINWDSYSSFHNKIMQNLLQSFVAEVVNVQLNLAELKDIHQNISNQRPSIRNSKLMTENAVLLFDYTRFYEYDGIEFAFEIKPKCGVDIEGKCKFCAKQSIKQLSGQIKHATNYCPKELFSGDAGRMKKAIKHLLENPQNNLMIYKNSKLIYNENNALDNTFLSNEFKCWRIINNIFDFIAELVTKVLLVRHSLCENCPNCTQNESFTVLELIYQLQELDSLNTITQRLENGYINSLMKKLSPEWKSFCLKCKIASIVSEPAERHYLSKIARDCSIMLTVREKHLWHDKTNKQRNVITVNETDYEFSAHVFDLFPKDEK